MDEAVLLFKSEVITLIPVTALFQLQKRSIFPTAVRAKCRACLNDNILPQKNLT